MPDHNANPRPQSDIEPTEGRPERSAPSTVIAWTALDSLQDPILLLDGSLRVTYANSSAVRMWQSPIAGAVGQTLLDLVPQLRGTPAESALREARDGTPSRFDLPLPVNGRWLSASFQPLSDGVSVQMRDITARVEATRRMKASEEYLVLAQKAAGIGTWSWDLRSNEIHWSAEMYQVLGVDPRTPPAERYDAWLQVLHPKDRSEVADMETRRATAQAGQFSREFRVIRPDGEMRWILAQGAIWNDENGPHRMLGLNIDITDRKNIETALHESQNRLRLLNERLELEAQSRARQLADSRARLQTFFDISLDWLSLFRAEPDGRFVYVDLNPACERAYGIPREQVIGFSVQDILGEEQAAVPLHHMRECLRTNRPERYRARRTLAGQTRSIDVVFVPVPGGSEGGHRLIVSTARDLTERDNLEAQLRHSQKLDTIGQLTGGIAHDFNNLLTAVSGSLELAMRRVSDGRTLRLLGMAAEAAERGTKLTAQMLAFSRKQDLMMRPVEVNTIIQHLQPLLRSTLGPAVRVRLELERALWVAMADPVQIEVMLLNLAVNARDAMPNGGELRIATRNASLDSALEAAVSPGDYVVLSVSDTGIGMSEEVRSRAFEPFFTTKEPGKGTGLGLAQVFGFARQCGGTATLDSRLGKGTTLTAYLPRSALPAQGAADTTETPTAGSPSRPVHVLLVDDDESVRALVREYLLEIGNSVTAVESGEAALKLLAERTEFDLLLVDFAMPGMNGSEVATLCRQICPRLPIVFMTGYADTNALRPWADRGCRTLNKPFRSDDLAGAIKEALSLPATDRVEPPATSHVGPYCSIRA